MNDEKGRGMQGHTVPGRKVAVWFRKWTATRITIKQEQAPCPVVEIKVYH